MRTKRYTRLFLICIVSLSVGCTQVGSVTTPTENPVESGTPFETVGLHDPPTECNYIDSSYYETTPAPYPTQPRTLTNESALSLAVKYERAYLRNWIVRNADPLGMDEYGEPRYPNIEAEYKARQVRRVGPDEYVVHLRYIREITNGSIEETRRTVNYYISPSNVSRAATNGSHYPGPNPTTEGRVLDCES
ncbi:MAG: hypothetical protein ABEH66_05385 [Halobacteriales archaeon]